MCRPSGQNQVFRAGPLLSRRRSQPVQCQRIRRGTLPHRPAENLGDSAHLGRPTRWTKSSPEYATFVAKVNGAALASLALAPSAPETTREVLTGAAKGRRTATVARGKSRYDAVLRWKDAPGGDLAGYAIVIRASTAPFWEQQTFVGKVTEYTLPGVGIDDIIFGVKAIDAEGHESLVAPWIATRTKLTKFRNRGSGQAQSGISHDRLSIKPRPFWTAVASLPRGGTMSTLITSQRNTMKPALFLFLALTAVRAQTATVLHAARLLDIETGRVLTPGELLIQGDRIVEAGVKVTHPDGAATIDLGDRTLMPGLIDVHVHLFLHPGAEDSFKPFRNRFRNAPLQRC